MPKPSSPLHHRPTWPLVWVLAVPLMLQGAIVAGLVSYFSYQSGQQDLEILADQLREQTSLRIRDHIDVNLAVRMQTLQVATQAIQNDELDPLDSDQLRRFFWQQINSLPRLSFITFASEQGQEIGYGRIQNPALKRQVDKQLNRPLSLHTPFLVQRSGPDWLNRRFYLVDSQGKPTQEIYRLRQDTRQFIWYQEARQRKGIHWSSVYVNYVVPSLHIATTAPWYDAQGQLQGVFSSPFPLSDLNTFIHELNFSPSGQAFVLDQAGHLLTSPDDEPLFQPFQANQGNVTPTLLKATESRHPWVKAIAGELDQNYRQVVQTDSDLRLQFPIAVAGEKLFVDVQRYRYADGLDWLLVVVIPESDFMREIQANQRRTGVFVLLSLLLGTGISLWGARLILRPLTQLNQASRALAQRPPLTPPSPTVPSENSTIWRLPLTRWPRISPSVKPS